MHNISITSYLFFLDEGATKVGGEIALQEVATQAGVDKFNIFNQECSSGRAEDTVDAYKIIAEGKYELVVNSLIHVYLIEYIASLA